ncbi:hypothetical protein AHAS_Ahas15G0337100 [Arachis hypogaea]
MQLKNRSNNIQIGALVSNYVLAKKSTIDALASVGEPNRKIDHACQCEFPWFNKKVCTVNNLTIDLSTRYNCWSARDNVNGT